MTSALARPARAVPYDEQALARFLAGVERRALRMAEITTANRDEALDVVQDAMAMLVSRYGQRPEDEWGPLFQRILQNRIRDWQRRATVRRRLRVWLGRTEDDEHLGEPLDALPDPRALPPEQSLHNAQALARLERALRQLPLRQRQTFLLRAWEGLDVARTAQVLGCSSGSVKTHYARALEKLQTLLQEFRP